MDVDDPACEDSELYAASLNVAEDECDVEYWQFRASEAQPNWEGLDNHNKKFVP